MLALNRKVNFSKIIDALIEVNYLLIIALMPLAFAIFSRNNNVFELNKIICFKVLIIFFLGLTLIKIIINGWEKYFSTKKFFLHYLLVPSIFLAYWGLNTLLAPDKFTSFFGLYDRIEGYESYLYYFLWFILLLYNLLTTPELKLGLKRLLMTITGAGVLVALYGILQIMAIDFVIWAEPPFLTGRITSTLGQPNYVGSYLILILPLAYYLFIKARNNWEKILWAGSGILQLIALYFTLSRSAWLGLILAIILTGLVYYFKNRQALAKKIIKRWVVSGVLVLICLGGLVWQVPQFKNRLQSAINFKEGSAAARVIFIKDAYTAFKQKPLIGSGLESQGERLIGAYDRDWGVFGYVNSRTNRVHNLIFDNLLTGGLLGLGLMILLYLWVYRLLLKNFLDKHNGFLIRCLFVGFSAYLVSLMFGFSFVASNVYFYLFVVLIIILDFKPNCLMFTKLNIIKPIRAGLLIALTALLIAGGALINLELKALAADYYFKEFINYWSTGDYLSALVLYRDALVANPRQTYYEQQFVAWLYNYNFPSNLPEPIIKICRDELKSIETNLPLRTYEDYQALARAEFMTNDLERAAAENQKVITRAPGLPENYLLAGNIAAAAGSSAPALTYYQEALSLAPALNDSRLNPEHQADIRYFQARILERSGDALFTAKDYPASRRDYEATLQRRFALSLYKKIADTYYQEHNFKMAIWYNERAGRLDPSDFTWPYILAILYSEQGDYSLASIYDKQALGLNPEALGPQKLLEEISARGGSAFGGNKKIKK